MDKTCTKCKLVKSSDSFFKNNKHYHTSWCKDCYKATSHSINMKRYYGINQDVYDDLLNKQDGKCAICEKEETAIYKKTGKVKLLSVDHCHQSKAVRGLLCSNCNHGLGKFKDDIELLKKAAEYLSEETK